MISVSQYQGARIYTILLLCEFIISALAGAGAPARPAIQPKRHDAGAHVSADIASYVMVARARQLLDGRIQSIRDPVTARQRLADLQAQVEDAERTDLQF